MGSRASFNTSGGGSAMQTDRADRSATYLHHVCRVDSRDELLPHPAFSCLRPPRVGRRRRRRGDPSPHRRAPRLLVSPTHACRPPGNPADPVNTYAPAANATAIAKATAGSTPVKVTPVAAKGTFRHPGVASLKRTATVCRRARIPREVVRRGYSHSLVPRASSARAKRRLISCVCFNTRDATKLPRLLERALLVFTESLLLVFPREPIVQEKNIQRLVRELCGEEKCQVVRHTRGGRGHVRPPQEGGRGPHPWGRYSKHCYAPRRHSNKSSGR